MVQQGLSLVVLAGRGRARCNPALRMWCAPAAEHLRAAADAAPPPSLLAGVFVRFKFENAYHLRQVEHAAVAADGKPALAIVHPTAPAPPLLLIPLASVSGTNPLQGRLRETAGVDELARLQACMAARAVRLPVQEVRRRRPFLLRSVRA
jgi:hypothetical protein